MHLLNKQLLFLWSRCLLYQLNPEHNDDPALLQGCGVTQLPLVVVRKFPSAVLVIRPALVYLCES